MLGFLCFRNPPNYDMDYIIFNYGAFDRIIYAKWVGPITAENGRSGVLLL